MALNKPTSHDIVKIHEEMTLLVNQRFILTTLAIGAFGAVGTLLVRHVPAPGQPIGSVVPMVSVILSLLLFSLLLFLLFIHSYSLRHMIRLLSAYLVVTNASNWERDFERYRGYWSFIYTMPQAIVFLCLNLTVATGSLFFLWAYSLKPEPSGIFWASIGISAIVELLIVSIVVGDRLWAGRRAAERWQLLDCSKETWPKAPSSVDEVESSKALFRQGAQSVLERLRKLMDGNKGRFKKEFIDHLEQVILEEAKKEAPGQMSEGPSGVS